MMSLIPDKIKCVPRGEIIQHRKSDCQNATMLMVEDVAAAAQELREKAERMRLTHRADKRDYEKCDETCEKECRWVDGFLKLIAAVFGKEGQK
mgnify:CR=1 FL=1